LTIRAGGIALALILSGAAAAGPRVVDGFEGETLDTSAWLPKDVRYGEGEDDPQLTLTTEDRRCGARAARVEIDAADPGRACVGCQRAEVWQAPAVRPRWGQETWVGFSIKVAGGSPAGSKRTVIGQWKTPSDRSPFLAARYDNRVLHLTVDTVNRTPELGGPRSVRRTIACSVGDPESLIAVQALLGTLTPGDRPRSLAEAAGLHERALTLLSPDSYAPAGAPDATETAPRLGRYLPEFACIQDPAFYAYPARVTVTPGVAPVLPDPGADWVDLQFGFRTGHQDSTVGSTDSRIEVWANGRHAATMTGDLDAPLHPGEDRSLYFKFGIYRERDERQDVVLLDEFRQGTAREEVVPGCPRP
jgi:hypothetical protein